MGSQRAKEKLIQEDLKAETKRKRRAFNIETERILQEHYDKQIEVPTPDNSALSAANISTGTTSTQGQYVEERNYTESSSHLGSLGDVLGGLQL
jgi:hypothetical protein